MADLQNGTKPNLATKTFGRNEAVENVRLLRIEDCEIARNATPVKAPLTRRLSCIGPARESKEKKKPSRRNIIG